MDMFFSAKRQTLAQFMEVYDRQRLNEVHGGSPVIFDAMANQSPQDRYEIVKFLVGEGAELTRPCSTSCSRARSSTSGRPWS